MMERITSQHETVTTTLCLVDKSNMCLTTEEKDTIITSLKLLEPFLQATEDISGDKYVSISMIIPLARLLQHFCSTGPHCSLRQFLMRELQKRFQQIEFVHVAAIGTLLDPRFKKLAFVEHSALEQEIQRLQVEVRDIELQNEDEEPSVEQPQTPPRKQSLWDTFDEKVAQATCHRTNGTDLFIEVRRYFEEKKQSSVSSPEDSGQKIPGNPRIISPVREAFL